MLSDVSRQDHLSARRYFHDRLLGFWIGGHRHWRRGRVFVPVILISTRSNLLIEKEEGREPLLVLTFSFLPLVSLFSSREPFWGRHRQPHPLQPLPLGTSTLFLRESLHSSLAEAVCARSAAFEMQQIITHYCWNNRDLHKYGGEDSL